MIINISDLSISPYMMLSIRPTFFLFLTIIALVNFRAFISFILTPHFLLLNLPLYLLKYGYLTLIISILFNILEILILFKCSEFLITY